MRLVLLFAITIAAPAEAGAPVPLAPDAPPPAVEITSGNPTVSAHVFKHAVAVAACAPGELKARVRIGWNARGAARTIVVSGGGPRFAGCVRKALAGNLSIPRRRAGSGVVSFIVRGTPPGPVVVSPIPVPEPAPAPMGGLQSCTRDADCTLHFRQHACVPGDPVAVHKSAPREQILKQFPVRHLSCGMGGPQYERLRASHAGRYGARCEQSRCTVVDHGEQPSLLGSP